MTKGNSLLTRYKNQFRNQKSLIVRIFDVKNTVHINKYANFVKLAIICKQVCEFWTNSCRIGCCGAVSKIHTQNWSIYQYLAPNTIFETNCKIANQSHRLCKCAKIAKKVTKRLSRGFQFNKLFAFQSKHQHDLTFRAQSCTAHQMEIFAQEFEPASYFCDWTCFHLGMRRQKSPKFDFQSQSQK